MITVKDIALEIEKIAPVALAQEWDNVGLLAGAAQAKVNKILMTIDVTKNVIEEAKRLNCNFILSYHPVIWDGLKSITADGPGEVVYNLVRNDIAVYSMHTSLDAVGGGVNDALADMVGIKNAEPIGDFVSNPDADNYKLVIFTPAEAVNKMAEAVFKAGAGAIGNYSHCSFRSTGLGTFKPLAGAKPTIGVKGKLEKVNEIRLEAIVPAENLAEVIAAMRREHPYEVPAFDVIKLYDIENKTGLGRIGKLAKPVRLKKILANIKKTTGAEIAGIVGKADRTVRRAAVCAGACGKIVNSVIAQNCDLYVTGELKHHQALAAAEAGLTVVCLSHTVSERFILKKIAKDLQKKLKDVKILVSKKDKDPFKWMQI